MKKKNLLLFIVAALILSNCKEKKKEQTSTEKNFPVLSFIQSQVADIDTSMYSIYKIVTLDTLRSDTVYIQREQFKEAAKDFLDIPDISSPEFAGRYKEDKQFDETLNRVIFTYTPIDPKEEIQRQEVLTNAMGDKVTNIIINRVQNSKDSSVEKKMLWQIDKSFQVITTKQLPGQPATISTLRVLWNGEEGQ